MRGRGLGHDWKFSASRSLVDSSRKLAEQATSRPTICDVELPVKAYFRRPLQFALLSRDYIPKDISGFGRIAWPCNKNMLSMIRAADWETPRHRMSKLAETWWWLHPSRYVRPLFCPAWHGSRDSSRSRRQIAIRSLMLATCRQNPQRTGKPFASQISTFD